MVVSQRLIMYHFINSNLQEIVILILGRDDITYSLADDEPPGAGLVLADNMACSFSLDEIFSLLSTNPSNDRCNLLSFSIWYPHNYS